MHVAIVGNFGLGYKGTMSARALPIGRELARRGHRVEIFIPDDGSPVRPPDSIDGVVVMPCRQIVPGGRLGHGATIVWRALRGRPDVVYAFKPIGFSGLALLIAWGLRRLGSNWPILALDADDWEGSGGWADREPGSRLRTALIDWQERWGIRHAEIVSVASRELERRARQGPGDVVYVPNAASSSSPGWRVGSGATVRAALNVGNEPIVLAYTRFVEFDPARLINVFALIVAHEPRAHLVVAGKGLAGEEVEFERLATERGFADRVHPLGWTTPTELPDVFAAASVAIYPMDDNLLNRAKCPMKLVDLLLAGVPVVADRVGQAAAYVRDGETGILVIPGDYQEMAARAIELLGDDPRRREIGIAARQSMLADWTWSIQATAIDLALATVRKR